VDGIGATAAYWGGTIAVYVTSAVGFTVFIVLSLSGYRYEENQRSYYFDDFKVNQTKFTTSLASTNIPLVLGLLVFLEFGASFGFLVVLLLLPIVLLPFGAMYFLGKPAGFLAEKHVTLHEFISSAFQDSKPLRRTAASISVLSFCLALGFELYYGSQILGSFLQLPEKSHLFVALFLAVLTGLYSCLGGFRAVFRTDTAQYSLLIVGVFAISFLMFLATPPPEEDVSRIVWFPPSELRWAAAITILGSLFYYPFWYLSTMDTWQRAATTSSVDSQRGWQITGMILVLIVYATAGITGSSSAVGEGGIVALLTQWLSSETWIIRAGGAVAFGGILAALVSTADTYSMMIVQSIDTDILLKDWRDQEFKTRKMSSRRVMVAWVPLAAVSLAVCVSSFDVTNPRSLFYASFAGQCALFVPLVAGLSKVAAEMSSNGGLSDFHEKRFSRWISRQIQKTSSVLGVTDKVMYRSVIAGYMTSLIVALSVSPDSAWLYSTPVIAVSIPAITACFVSKPISPKRILN